MNNLPSGNPEEQFAFYINAYNAWTIKLILTGYPGVKSIKEHYFNQVAPQMEWQKVRAMLWRAFDGFGKEGSIEKEEAIKNRIL